MNNEAFCPITGKCINPYALTKQQFLGLLRHKMPDTSLLEGARKVIYNWETIGRHLDDFPSDTEPFEVRLARGYLELAEYQMLKDKHAGATLER